MKLYKNSLLKISILLCFVVGFFCNFQYPVDDAKLLKEKFDYYKSTYQMDSMLVYHQYLLKIFEKEKDVLKIFEQKKDLILYQVYNGNLTKKEKINLIKEQKKEFAIAQKSSPDIQAWLLAYPILLASPKDIEDSAQYYLPLLKNKTSPTDQSALLHTYNILLDYYLYEKNDLSKVNELLEKQNTTIKNKADAALVFSIQCSAYIELGLLRKGIEKGLLAISYYEKHKYVDSSELALIYNTISVAYMDLYADVESEIYVKKSLDYLPKNESHQEELAINYYNLASFYFDTKKEKKLLIFLKKGLTTITQIPFAKRTKNSFAIEVSFYALFSKFYIKKTNLKKVDFYINKMQKLKKIYEIEDLDGTIAYANYLILKSKLNEAEIYIQKYIKIFQEKDQLFFQLDLLAEIQYKQNKKKLAIKTLNNAIWLNSSLPKNNNEIYPPIQTVLTKRKLLEITETKAGIELELYKESKYNYSLKKIYNTTQFNLKLIADLQLEFYQKNSKIAFFDTNQLVFEQAIDACWLMFNRYNDLQYLHQAFSIAEQSKSILLQDALQEREAKELGGVPLAQIAKEIQLQQQITKLQQKEQYAIAEGNDKNANFYRNSIFDQQKIIEKSKIELEKKYPKYRALKHKKNTPSVISIQQKIADSTAMVMYFEGNKSIYQFLINKDTFLVKKIIWRTYRKTLDRYYQHFVNNSPEYVGNSKIFNSFASLSYEFYHKILHLEQVAAAKHLILIPDGLLTYIPFETFVTKLPPISDTVAYNKLAYLFTTKSISYSYGASLWLNNLNPTQKVINSKVLGMGATYINEKIPTFRNVQIKEARKKLNPIKGTIKELSILEKNYEGDYYIDKYASEYYFKKYASKYGILHLALHSVVNKRQPNFSSLVFAEDAYEKEDNFLTINEIKQLDLQAGLVVLSTCQSGYGKYQKGEGVISLGRSFMYAGSPAIIMTLWQVNDMISAKVMNYFYDNLKKGLPKDEALQKAKLKYLSIAEGAAAHPVFWAAYIQVGNTDNIQVLEPIIHVWWFIIPIFLIALLGWWSMQALRQRK